jgi:hypothetical protein
MVTISDGDLGPQRFGHLIRFADELLACLVNRGHLDGPHLKLLAPATTLVVYLSQDSELPWPGRATPLIELVGESAIIIICECRNHPATHQQLRIILQDLFDACCTPISGQPATTEELSRQQIAFCSIRIAVHQMNKLKDVS